MLVAGIVLLSLGSAATAAAVGLEIKYKEPIWMIVMKGGCFAIAVGSLLYTIG